MYKQCVTRGLSHLVPLEGVRLVEDALAAKVPLDTVYIAEDVDMGNESTSGRILSGARRNGARIVIVSTSVAESMADTRTPQGVFALAKWSPASGCELLASAGGNGRPSFGVYLDGVSDPGNVGTIIRTAAALGALGVVAGPRCAGFTNPKVIRASMGSIFRMPVAEVKDVDGFFGRAAELGYDIIVSDSEVGGAVDNLVWPGCARPQERSQQVAKPQIVGHSQDTVCLTDRGADGANVAFLVVGSEAFGVSDAVRKHATARVKIEMARDVESLNVAAAAAILIYALRQKVVAWEDARGVRVNDCGLGDQEKV